MHPYTRGLLDSVPSRNTPRPAARADPRHDAVAAGAGRGAAPSASAARARPSPAATRARRARARAPGRTLRCCNPVAMSAAAAPLLELRGVSKRFVKPPRLRRADRAQARRARRRDRPCTRVDDVSLAVREGEVVGLVGESGCGKSTLGRMVARILEPTAGERFWKGRPLRGVRGARRARRAPRGADDLPGPVRVAQPAHAHRRHRRRGAAWCTGWCTRGERERLRRRHAAARRHGRRAHAPLPAPVLRRAAQPHRHRARARGEAALPGVRRGGGRARRLDPGAGAEPLHPPARGARRSPTSSSATTWA